MAIRQFRRWVAVLAACGVMAMVSQLQAAEPYQEYNKRIDSARLVGALKSDLFGDSVSLYNGATEFTVTDVDVPGNSALPVRIGRRFVVESQTLSPYGIVENLGGFGPWDMDIPYIHGTFIDQWGVAGGGHQRCTQFGVPKHYAGFEPKDYWSGSKLYMPGAGDQDILRIGNLSGLFPKMQAPADGHTYSLGTKNFHRIRCKATTANGYPGEGFIVLDTQGVTYTFDVAVQRMAGVIRKFVSEQSHGMAQTSRDHVYLMPSRAEDRFGNWVSYEWVGGQLRSITANDGRSIVLTWSGRNVTKVVAGGREWTYGFVGSEYRVTLPDGSAWKYSNLGPVPANYPETDYETTDARCLEAFEGSGQSAISMTHPSGAVGQFSFSLIRHRRSGVPQSACSPYAYVDIGGYTPRALHAMAIPDYFDVPSLVGKIITGPGLAPQAWTYAYDIVVNGRTTQMSGPTYPCTNCQDAKSVFVTNPDGTVSEHRFGTLWEVNDGRLLAVYTRRADNAIVRRETYDYMSEQIAGSMPFPDIHGYSMSADDTDAVKIRPVTTTTIVQDGDIPGPVYWSPEEPPPPPPPCWETGECDPPPPCTINPATGECDDPMRAPPPQSRGSSSAATSSSTPPDQFVRTVTAFDAFGRPLAATKSSSLGYSKTETTEYYDHLGKWVLGQVARGTVNGTETVRTEFDANALPWKLYEFNKLRQTLTYYADGTVATVKDGNNNVTTLSDWYRGIPRHIAYADSTATSAAVDPNGWVTAVVDENGYATGYGYDAMGRLASIVPPTGDSTAWNTQSSSFTRITAGDWMPPGISAGQWKHMAWQGSYRKITYYDAMWRPLLVHEYDETNTTGTLRAISTGYDSSGRVAFQSYPSRDMIPAASGTWTFYDALDRVVQVKQDSEHGQLTTTTEYLAGFQTRVTNPRGFQTLTSYMAYDQPGYDLPTAISELGGNRHTEIHRDVFGKPTGLIRSNGSLSQWSARYYVYDDAQRLCKSIEPETGATVMGYDDAGNLAWSASGLTGTNFASQGECSHVAAFNAGRTVLRSYDARNRLKTLNFPDGRGDQLWAYYPDGLTEQITTWNDAGGGGPVVNRYDYNKRRLLTGESTTQPGWYAWGLGYGYNANGSLTNNTYPTGLVVNYSPNALGQATAVTSNDGRTYASGVQYYPNGAISQFAYGNGVVHAMTQNARQLPRTVVSAGVSSYEYTYDANANVQNVYDWQTPAYHRYLSYDGLDRLTDAGSQVFGGDHWHRFSYDALDNLKSWKLAGVKDYANYVYDASNRLTNIQNTAGASIVGLGYDVQGNLANKNGQAYTFDYGNRLRETVGKEWYRYDGHGRRVLKWRTNEPGVLSMYGQSGQVFYDENYRVPDRKATEYIYLAGSLIATRARNVDNSAWTFSFQHTDALGSPVAVTNEAGQVIDRTQWEPYGAAIGKPAYDGTGYTGHVMDGATGLTYMQQRYYDQQIGRFLSVDPVTAYDNGDMRFFNRYVYAFNNPYKFTDPDGRESGMFQFQHRMEQPPPEGIIAAAKLTAELTPVGRSVSAVRTTVNIVSKTYTTYTRQKADGTPYSGKTSGKGTPEQQVAARTSKPDHQAKTAEGYGPAKVDKNSPNSDAIRGREQQLIDKSGGAQSQGGTSGNKINSVSDTNPKAETYRAACKKEFGC